MNKCLVCEKEVERNEELCHSCEAFFKWRYGGKFKQFLEDLKKYLSKRSPIKFRRTK